MQIHCLDNDFDRNSLVKDDKMKEATRLVRTLAVASYAAASEVVGENSQPFEAEKLLLIAAGSGFNHAVGAVQENKEQSFQCVDIQLDQYETGLRKFLQELHDDNLECGIMSGVEDFFGQEQELHFLWAYGVEPHVDVHTSLAVLYKCSKNMFVMLKIDLQDTSGNFLMATGSRIFIKHEVRVVGGIDRNIWSEPERAVDMSLGHFFSTIKGVMDGMNKEYSLLKNNCIR